MTPDRAFEDYYPQLQSVVTKIMCHVTDFSMLFSLVSNSYLSIVKHIASPSLYLQT